MYEMSYGEKFKAALNLYDECTAIQEIAEVMGITPQNIREAIIARTGRFVTVREETADSVGRFGTTRDALRVSCGLEPLGR